MKYKISKQADDGRVVTAGIVLPDGFYRIFTLTRDNHAFLERVAERGYLVEEIDSDDKRGIYTEYDNQRCDDKSVYDAFCVRGGGMNSVKFLQESDPEEDATQKLGLSKSELRRLGGHAAPRRRESTTKVREGNTVSDLRKSLGAMGVNIPAGAKKQDMEHLLETAIAGV